MWVKLKIVCPIKFARRSSSNNPDNLLPLVAVHVRCYQLSFNSCWNVRVLHKLFLNTNFISCCHLELAYQFIP